MIQRRKPEPTAGDRPRRRRAANRGVYFTGPPRGPWKVRWRDGTINPATGKPVLHASALFTSAMDRDTFIAQTAKQLAARKARRAGRGRPALLASVIAEWKADQLAKRKVGEAYAIEVDRNLTRMATITPATDTAPAEMRWARLLDVSMASVEQWMKDNGYGAATDKPLRQLKRLLRWAAKPPNRYAIDDQVLDIERPQYTKRKQPDLLSDEHVREIVARAYEFGDHVGLFVECLAVFGNRHNELCRLDVADWDAVRCTLTVRDTKNGKDVSYPVADERLVQTFDKITAGRDEREALFLNPQGERWRKNPKTKIWTQARDWYRANVGRKVAGHTPQASIYCLKDHALSVMDRLGIDDRTKSGFTGITRMQTYDHYKATNRERVARASAVIAARAPGAPLSANHLDPDQVAKAVAVAADAGLLGPLSKPLAEAIAAAVAEEVAQFQAAVAAAAPAPAGAAAVRLDPRITPPDRDPPGIRQYPGCTGVSAHIKVGGKKIHLGTFTDRAAAIAARRDAEWKFFGGGVANPSQEREHFGEHARPKGANSGARAGEAATARKQEVEISQAVAHSTGNQR